MVKAMKIFFSIMLIFLLLSCGGGKKTPESVIPDEDSVSDVDIAEADESDDEIMPDADIVEADENDDEIISDADIESDEDNASDADSDTEIIPDPCETEPCKGIEHSTETCFSYGKHYGCECDEGYLWQGSEKGCVDRKMFSGAVCTGQTKCYDMEKEIPCPKEGEPFYGQDAQYAEMGKCIPRSYTIKKYDDGETVIDNNTGLEWQRSVRDSDCFNTGCTKQWRRPSILEQFTIVDSDYSEQVVNSIYFPDTPSLFFCSEETQMTAGFQHREVSLKGMDFKDGLVKSYYYSDRMGGTSPEGQVGKCVRVTAGKVPQKIIVQNDSDVVEKNWKDALDYCENLTLHGISEWRLPNRNEIMLSNVEASWTSTTVAGYPSMAWSFHQTRQYPYHEDKTRTFPVRCVASDPCGEDEKWDVEKCVPLTEKDRCDIECAAAKYSLNYCVENEDGKYACQCEWNHFYDGKNCVNPCDTEPCKGGAEESGGECKPTSESTYKCDCKYYNGYVVSNDETSCQYFDRCPFDQYEWIPYPTCLGNFMYSRYMWSSTYVRSGISWKEAKQYCDNLTEGGYSDWQFPSIDILKLQPVCSQIGFTDCKVSEEQGCLVESCVDGCICPEAPENQGTFIWSSSLVSDKEGYAFAMLSRYGNIVVKNVGTTDGMNVRCVRNYY